MLKYITLHWSGNPPWYEMEKSELKKEWKKASKNVKRRPLMKLWLNGVAIEGFRMRVSLPSLLWSSFVGCRSSSPLPSSVFTFQHGQFMADATEMANKFNPLPQPTIFHTESNCSQWMVEAVALLWFVCNVFFIIAISFIWCCLDSWVRDRTLTLRWNGKREKSPRLLTLDVVVACWNQDKCFPSTTMCLYNSGTKLSLLCSNFSTFPHFGRMRACVCCACGMYVFFAGSSSQTQNSTNLMALFFIWLVIVSIRYSNSRVWWPVSR